MISDLIKTKDWKADRIHTISQVISDNNAYAAIDGYGSFKKCKKDVWSIRLKKIKK